MPLPPQCRWLFPAALATASALPACHAYAQSHLSIRGGVTPEGPFSQMELLATGEGTATMFLIDPNGTAFAGSTSNALVAWDLSVDFNDLAQAPMVGNPAVVSPAGVEVTQFSAAFSAVLDTHYVAARDGSLFGGPGNEPSLVGWTVSTDFATASTPVELAAVGSAAGIAAIPGTGNFAVNRIDGVNAQQQVSQTYGPTFLPVGTSVNGPASPFPVLETPDIHAASDGTQVVSALNINNNTLSVYAIDAAGNRGPTQTIAGVIDARVYALDGGRAHIYTAGAGGVVMHDIDDLLTATAGTDRPIHAGFVNNLHVSLASDEGISIATYTANGAVYGRAISTRTGAAVGSSFLVSSAPAGGNVFNGASAPVGNGTWVHVDIQQPSFNIITAGSIAHQDRNGQSIFLTDPGELLVLADAFPSSATPIDQAQNLTYDTPSIGSFAIVENPNSAFDGAVMFDFDDEGTLTVEAGATWQEVADALGTDDFILRVSLDMMVSDGVEQVDMGFGGWTIGAAFLEENAEEVLDLEEYRGQFGEYSLEAVVTAEDLAMTEGNAGFVIGGTINLPFRSGSPATRGGPVPDMGSVTLDNVRITARPVPEPGSAGLLLAACGLAGMRCRSR